MYMPKFLYAVKDQGDSPVTIWDGSVLFGGFLVFVDGTNDPTITIYDNNAASGETIIPATTYDAVYYGNQGFMPGFPIVLDNGIHLVISIGAGSCKVVVLFRPHKIVSP